METMNPRRRRMTKINPINWMGELLRLMHITRSNKTADHHHDAAHHPLPVIAVPRTDLVDDPAPSDIPPDDIILPDASASNLLSVDNSPSDIPPDGIIVPVASNLLAVNNSPSDIPPDGIILPVASNLLSVDNPPSDLPYDIILPVASNLLSVDNPPSDLVDLPYDIVIPVVAVSQTDSSEVDDPLSDHVDLPYDIILDILSRLPVTCIFECQCVSRPLQVLTTTPSFTRIQRQRSTPVIVVQFSSIESEFTKLYYMDKEFKRIEEKTTRSSPVGVVDPNFLLGSYDGFLTFGNIYTFPKTFYMWNPITGYQLTMKDEKMHVCGLYFNPVRKGYELLYYTTDECAQSGQYCNFGALNLRSKLTRDVGRFSYPPSRRRPPVIVKGTLYWMIYRSYYSWFNRAFIPPFSDSIMSFNIETEEFSTLEPGGRKYNTEKFSEGLLRTRHLHLSKIDGALCLCDFVRFNQLLLSIFNHATHCWSTRTIVVLPEYPGRPIYDWPNSLEVEVVQIKDNELLVRQGRRLVLYNMLSHACKTSELMGSKGKGIRATVHTNIITSFHL